MIRTKEKNMKGILNGGKLYSLRPPHSNGSKGGSTSNGNSTKNKGGKRK
jgi:hypothetical protein